MLIQLFNPFNISMLLLRIIVGLIFIANGWIYLTKTAQRSKDIEMSLSFTYLLGAAELTAGFFLLAGVFVKPSSALLMLIILGGIGFKLIRLKTGFLGYKIPGWYYDLILLAFNLVLFSYGSGKYNLL